MHTIHNLLNLSMSEAYDYTQYSDTIKDGDILIVKDGVGVMVEAWPSMASGESKVFHKPTSDFHEQTNNKYLAQFNAAQGSVHQLVSVAKPCQPLNTWEDIEF